MEPSKNQNESVAPLAQVVNLQELSGQGKSGPQLLAGNFSVIAGVKVKVEVVVGGAELSVGELFALQAGSVVELDQLRDAPLYVRLDGQTIASGTLVVVGEHFGIRIADVTPVAATAGQ